MQDTNIYDNSGRPYHHYQGTGTTGPDHRDPYGQQTQLPASGAVLGPNAGVHHDNHHSRSTSGGTGTKLTGKVESALGSLVGSNALKAKGFEKEGEANAAHIQGLELAEAERLEREALMRRQKVVGQGAHPANATPGAGQFGSGSGPTGTQPRPGAGMPGKYPQ